MEKQPADISQQELVEQAFFGLDIATTVTMPFLRIGGGIGQPGFPGLWVAIGMPLWGAMIGSDAVLIYWYAWIAATLIYRIYTEPREHSMYAGRPWLCQWIVEGERAACLLEGPLVMAAGYLIPDHGMGWMLLASGGASLITELVHRESQHRRKVGIGDAEKEMQMHRDLFKRD